MKAYGFVRRHAGKLFLTTLAAGLLELSYRVPQFRNDIQLEQRIVHSPEAFSDRKGVEAFDWMPREGVGYSFRVPRDLLDPLCYECGADYIGNVRFFNKGCSRIECPVAFDDGKFRSERLLPYPNQLPEF